jgi:hypothetical protein
MIKTIKIFILGFVYIIGSPLIALFFVLFLIYAILAWVLLVGKSIVIFFTGRTIFSDLPEDKELKKVIASLKQKHTPAHKESGIE